MHVSHTSYDLRTADLMARVLDDAVASACSTDLGVSEDDWTEMAEAISDAVAGGLRNPDFLQRTALNALAARRQNVQEHLPHIPGLGKHPK
jgi:hypothetical protein